MGARTAKSCLNTRTNWFLAAFCRTVCQYRTFSRPQARQSCISLWTPLPQDLQRAGVLLPFLNLARWTLQYCWQQLFPQATFKQAQRSCPFIIATHSPQVYSRCCVSLKGEPGSSSEHQPLVHSLSTRVEWRHTFGTSPKKKNIKNCYKKAKKRYTPLLWGLGRRDWGWGPYLTGVASFQSQHYYSLVEPAMQSAV